MAKQQDITIYRAEDVLVTYTMDPVVDVTGWTIVFTVKKSYASNDALFFVNVDLNDPTNGIFRFSIPNALTFLMSPGNYIYDVVRTDPGSYTVLSIGNFIVKPGVRAS